MDIEQCIKSVFSFNFKIAAILVKGRYGSDPEILTISGKVGEEITLQMSKTWKGQPEPEIFGPNATLELQDGHVVLNVAGQARQLCSLGQIDSIKYNLSDDVWGECFPERIYSEKRLIEVVDQKECTVMLKCPECNNMFPEDMSECSACGWVGQNPHGHCPECGGWATSKEWIPKCECGWGEYNEKNFVVVVHWPDESVTLHREFPTTKNMTSPVSDWISVMPKNEIILGVMERLEFSLYYQDKDEEGNPAINVVKSYQDSEDCLNSEVIYIGKKYGSYRNWDSRDTWTCGDGSSTWLHLEENGDINIYRRRFSERDQEWPDEPEVFAKVCNVKDVVKMTFFTTSGWHGDCYPIRTAIPKKYGSQFYRDGNWGTVFHRSTGAITLTDFPFEIMALRPDPEWMRQDYIPASELRLKEEPAILESTSSENPGEYIIPDSEDSEVVKN